MESVESGSQPASSLERPTNLLAELVGTCIALLTLILPLLVIAYYSNSAANNRTLAPSAYSLQQPNH